MIPKRKHDCEIRDLRTRTFSCRLFERLGPLAWSREVWNFKQHPKRHKTLSLDHNRHRIWAHTRMKKVW